MAGCRTYRKRLSAFLDGELPPEQRAALEAHVAACAACRRVLDALKGLGPQLEELKVPAPPDGLVAGIMAEARHRGYGKSASNLFRPRPAGLPQWPWAFKALGTAAILVLMLSFGIFVSIKGWLPGTGGGRAPVSVTAAGTAEGLEWFAPGPPGSLLSGYLALIDRSGPAPGRPRHP